MRSHLRLRFVGNVDDRLKHEARLFMRWLREWYSFDTPLEVRLLGVPAILDDDGEQCSLRWWQSYLGAEPVIAEIAVGSFAQDLADNGPTVAYPTVIASIARVAKYYFQATMNSPIREDYAEAWGDKVLDAYVDDSTPPPPWRGAKLS